MWLSHKQKKIAKTVLCTLQTCELECKGGHEISPCFSQYSLYTISIGVTVPSESTVMFIRCHTFQLQLCYSDRQSSCGCFGSTLSPCVKKHISVSCENSTIEQHRMACKIIELLVLFALHKVFDVCFPCFSLSREILDIFFLDKDLNPRIQKTSVFIHFLCGSHTSELCLQLSSHQQRVSMMV